MCQSGMAYHSAFSCKSKVIELCIINFTTTSQFTWELFSLFWLFTSQKVKKWEKISRIFSKLHTNHWWIVACKDLPGILFWKKDAVMFDLLLWYFFFTFFHLHKPKKVNCETTNVKRKAKISNRHWVIARGCTITPSFKKLSIACGSRTDVMKESFQDFFWRHAPSSNYTSLDLWYVFFFLHTISLNWPI